MQLDEVDGILSITETFSVILTFERMTFET